MSSASNIDPDVQAAFSGTPPTASSHSNIDSDISDAFADTGSKSNGATQVRATAALREADSLDPTVSKAINSKWNPLNWPQMVADRGADELASGSVHGQVTNPEAKNPENWSQPEPGMPLAATALKLVPAVAGMSPILRGLGGGAGMDAQSAVNQAFARTSGGAAAAAPNISGLSPELQAAISKAGPNIQPEALSRHLEADSLPIPVRLTAGQATQDPALISQEQNARGKFPQLSQRYQEQNQALIDNLDEIRRTTAPDAVGNDPVQNGQALLDKYKAYDAPKVDAISAAYNDANIANKTAGKGSLQLDPQPGLNHAAAALEDREDLLPSEGKTILAKMQTAADAGAGIPLKQAETWKTIVSRASRKYEQAGDTNAVSALSDFRDSLEQMEPADAAKGVQAKFNTARSMAKARFDEIDADPAYKAAVNDDTPMGEQSPIADDFVKKYIIGGKKANLDLMKAKFSADPEAQGTLQASALNYLKAKSGIDPYTNTGNFSQAGFNRARADLEPRMDSLLDPQTADQVRTLGNVARYTQMQPRGSFVNNSNTFTAQAAEYGKSALEQATNYAAKGVPVGTWMRKAAQGRSASNEINEALAPGAGLEKQ
jgi:hypothetical protein